MNEKEEPMNMNVTPPVEPVTEFEVPLPPDRKRPKWLVPLIAGGTAVVVLAAVGTGGYLYWNHNQLTAASEECATSYEDRNHGQGFGGQGRENGRRIGLDGEGC